MGDQDIIQQIRQKQERGFALMMERYCTYVSVIVSNLGRDALSQEDMEEICADVFIAVWNNGGKLRGESLRPYIAQIARNATVSRLRKKGRPAVPLDDDILTVTVGDSPDELAIQREQGAIINQAVSEMSGQEREIFIRYYFWGEALGPMAQRMGVPNSTVRSKLHRCRKKLKHIFAGKGIWI